MSLNLQELRNHGFTDEAAAIESGLHVPSNILKSLKNGDYEHATELKFSRIADICADEFKEQLLFDLDYNPNLKHEELTDLSELLQAYEGVSFFDAAEELVATVSEDDTPRFEKLVCEKTAVKFAEELAEQAARKFRNAETSHAVIEGLRGEVSDPKRVERIDQALDRARLSTPAPGGP